MISFAIAFSSSSYLESSGVFSVGLDSSFFFLSPEVAAYISFMDVTFGLVSSWLGFFSLSYGSEATTQESVLFGS